MCDWVAAKALVDSSRPAAQSAWSVTLPIGNPLTNRSGESGLCPFVNCRWNTIGTDRKVALAWWGFRRNGRPQALDQCEVDEWHTDF
jgi:hypothetical protein